jgi:hypothetical protein
LNLDRRQSAVQTARPVPAIAPLLGCLVLLSGCAAVAPFSAAPRLPADASQTAGGAGGTAGPAASGRPVAVPLDAPPPAPPSLGANDPRRRQYYDQARKRYYFFDPVLKRYFWSDGTPK